MNKKRIPNGYYAVFEKEPDGYSVHFPGLSGCLTQGDDMEDAWDMAVDALSGWIACAENIPEPLKYKDVVKDVHFEDQEIMMIPVVRAIVAGRYIYD